MSELNYQMAFESAVFRKQIAYNNYKKTLVNWITHTWIGNDGNFCFLQSDYKAKLDKAEEEFRKASIEVEHYRMVKGANNE